MPRVVHVILVALSAPFVIPLGLLWVLIAAMMSLPAWLAALASSAISWGLALQVLHSPLMDIIDWPIVISVACSVILVLPSDRMRHAVVATGVLAYGVTRVCLFRGPSEGATIAAITATTVCCVPWTCICQLQLWIPASVEELERTESKIYQQFIETDVHLTKIAGLGTVYVPYCGPKVDGGPRTLVLVHGYMAGNVFWAPSLQALARHFVVYAVEWRGVGRSDRPKFRPKSEKEAHAFFVDALEEWRKERKLEEMLLCGHSMGGMHVTFYATRYPHHVTKLLLVSPAGLDKSPLIRQTQLPLPRLLTYIFKLTPMSSMHLAGPFGRSRDMDFELLVTYTYHNWTLRASGDRAIHSHLHPVAYARGTPLVQVLTPAFVRFPVLFFYGDDNDWMNHTLGEDIFQRLTSNGLYSALYRIPDAGHQVFIDNPMEFNQIVLGAIKASDTI
ncbi:hypothetical protein Poli38472_004284 [Pythium oligandrum]|uniref:AB hydrolase-1 domain-containing protein n=1 Tax=Pythium oligandrum TaxID=41045 RepID=A0A8K1CN27_PYTOL|nr:hypothetical protein Poli38472_004284 [Pythium oligandrum]|eukprot:TMW66519.1 hypothetical protein Poli38472_004284 [Pythium oligandrum]